MNEALETLYDDASNPMNPEFDWIHFDDEPCANCETMADLDEHAFCVECRAQASLDYRVRAQERMMTTNAW